MSTRVVSAIGLPASSVSSRPSSSFRFVISSAIRQSILPRSAADIFPQGPSKAARPARTAASMSGASASAISVSVSPVAGFSVGNRFPLWASRHSPPIRSFPPEARRGVVIVASGVMVVSV
jgi:hypothetical protein